MKVILVNGSPKPAGSTYTALTEIASILKEQGVETEIFHLGNEAIAGCSSCNACRKLGKCVINDRVNDFLAKIDEGDAYVFGSPVHYASITGSLSAFLTRVFGQQLHLSFVGSQSLAL